MTRHFLLLILFLICCAGVCSAQRKSSSKVEATVSIPDTVLIRTDRGNVITSRFYVVNGTNLMRISHNSETEKCDTTFFAGLDEDDRTRYNKEVYLIKLRSKPIEQINDREAFNYFQIGDSIEYFLSKLGSKKVRISYTGYQLSFPDEFSGKPQVIEYKFWDDGILHGIERITEINTLPTNDVWTAFQLMQIKDSLNDLENAVKLLQSRQSTTSKSKKATQRRK